MAHRPVSWGLLDRLGSVLAVLATAYLIAAVFVPFLREVTR